MSRLVGLKTSIASFSLAVLLSSVVLLCLELSAHAQEVWEYSPYRVKVWVSVSPTLSLSDESEREIHRQISEYAELNFGPTWAIQVESTPDALFGSVLYRLDDLTADQLLARELILVVGKSDEAKAEFLIMNPPPPKPPEDPKAPKKKRTKEEIENMADLEARAASLQSVRTLEAAIQKIKHIAIQPLQYAGMKRDIVPFLDKKQWVDFKEIVKPFQGTNEELQNQLASGKIIGALVQKQDLEKFKKVARTLPTRLPWQPEALLRDNDKIFLASVDKVGESIRIQVKELDSFVRRMGEIAAADVVCKQDIARTVAELAKVAFSPIVRIEETDFKTAVLRVKATGLLTKEDHPIRVLPGDVLLPIIRRDDPNGNPTVLQTIPFTFIAITEKIDSVSRLYGAIFTASRGALSTAKNRRTQRVGLKVSPTHPETNIKLGMQRVPDSSFVGAEIYRRTPGSEDLEMVGRTDWRGVLTIGVSDLPTIQYDPPGESKTQAISNARKLAPEPVAPPEYELVDDPVAANAASTASADSLAAVKEPSKNSGDDENDEPPKKAESPKAPEVTKRARGFIQINVPLYLYYVKNGSTLLARLPIVNGMKSIEQADLPDDRRRLETEGLLKGMQSEVLDIVIRRKVLESRIKQEIAKKDLVKAEKLLDELKRVKSFEKMSEQVESIQRRALSTEKGSLLSGVVKRIESMLDVTRQLMQKYLQDTLVRTLETEIINSK
ncbi:MAG: hypothetical protein NTY15_20025 [Planctomycetota bacterium]|nr:hypothetical protein [Planctomycetota bacterium]